MKRHPEGFYEHVNYEIIISVDKSLKSKKKYKTDTDFKKRHGFGIDIFHNENSNIINYSMTTNESFEINFNIINNTSRIPSLIYGVDNNIINASITKDANNNLHKTFNITSDDSEGISIIYITLVDYNFVSGSCENFSKTNNIEYHHCDIFSGGSEGVTNSDNWTFTDNRDPNNIKRYGLVTGYNTLAVYDITNLDNVYELDDSINRITHPGSVWGDVKVYNEINNYNYYNIPHDPSSGINTTAGFTNIPNVYCYVSNENTSQESGVQIIDLTNINNNSLPGYSSNGSSAKVKLIDTIIGNVNITNIHNLHVDEHSGFLYTCGGGTNSGSLVAYDLNPSLSNGPENPLYVGRYFGPYVHDVHVVDTMPWNNKHTQIVDGNTILKQYAYCSCGNTSDFHLLDVTDKSNFQIIAPINNSGNSGFNPYSYPHQGWLSTNKKYFYANDEVWIPGSYDTSQIIVLDSENMSSVDLCTNDIKAKNHNMYVIPHPLSTEENPYDIIFQSNYTSGLRVFLVNENNLGTDDPYRIKEIGYFNSSIGPNNPSDPSEYNYNGTWSNHIQTYEDDKKVVIFYTDLNIGVYTLSMNLDEIETTTFTLDIGDAWELLSIPLINFDSNILDFYSIYKYEKGMYVSTNKIIPRQTYWIRSKPNQYSLTGINIITPDIISINSSWQLISGLTQVSIIVSNHPYILYKYDVMYQKVDNILEPLKGYWIKSLNNITQDITIKILSPPIGGQYYINIDLNTDGIYYISLPETDDNNLNLTYNIINDASNGSATIDGNILTYTTSQNSVIDIIEFSINNGYFDSIDPLILNIYLNITYTDLYVEILTDNYASETTWDIVDDSNNLIDSGGSNYNNNTLYIEKIQLSPGSYTFTIYDSYGDGICCSYGIGYFKLYTNNNLIFDSNSQDTFSTSFIYTFTID